MTDTSPQPSPTPAARRSDVLAVIPARSGSKGIPHKNIRPFLGTPLMGHSIRQALESRLIGRTIVSTDSAEYAATARQLGAEVPFLRPADIAGDLSTDLDVFAHALDWLKRHEGYEPAICVHLRPTYPTRRVSDIDAMIDLLLHRNDLDAVRSVGPALENPFKMWFRDEAGLLSPVVTAIDEAYNLPRQRLPVVYLQNACIDVVRARVIVEQRSMTGRRILGYVMDANHDIDDERDFQRALDSTPRC